MVVLRCIFAPVRVFHKKPPIPPPGNTFPVSAVTALPSPPLLDCIADFITSPLSSCPLWIRQRFIALSNDSGPKSCPCLTDRENSCQFPFLTFYPLDLDALGFTQLFPFEFGPNSFFLTPFPSYLRISPTPRPVSSRPDVFAGSGLEPNANYPWPAVPQR